MDVDGGEGVGGPNGQREVVALVETGGLVAWRGGVTPQTQTKAHEVRRALATMWVVQNSASGLRITGCYSAITWARRPPAV